MSEYNVKNYTEQGGEVTHIGGKLVFDEGAAVEGFPGGESGYTLPPATASVLGGVKVGAGLTVEQDGTLAAEGIVPAANQAASTATGVDDLKNDFNALLTKLKAAGLMAADSTTDAETAGE